jgi:hypothetical protein
MNCVSNSFFSCFRDPDDSDSSCCSPAYIFKKAVATVSFFTDVPTAWAAVGQLINEHVLPFFGELADSAHHVEKISSPVATAFKIVDLGEHMNDLHYFINGDAYKDLSHFRIASLAAHILQVPIHWINTSIFLKAIDLAGTIGELRVFSWAAKAGEFLQNVSWLKSVPHIAEAGQWLSEVQIFKWIPALAAYGKIAEGAALAVNVLQFADALHGYLVAKQKIVKAEKKYVDRLIQKHKFTREHIDSLISTHKVSNIAKLSFAELNQIDPLHPKIKSSNQLELGRLKVKLLHQQNKEFRAKVDAVAAVAQAVLQGVLIIGCAHAAVLFGLGAFALIALGASLYYKATLTKPDLADQLL